MKRYLSSILIVFLLSSLGNFSVFLGLDIPQASALSNSWNFDTPANYTLSNSNSFTLATSSARLSLNFNHIGSTTSANLNGAYDLIVEGNYAYMTSFLGDRFSVIDISTPSSPTIVASLLNNNGTLKLNGATALVKKGNYIYIASRISDAIQIIDVSTPTNPVAAGNIVDNAGTLRLDGARGIAIQGNTMYVASDISDALQTINIVSPTSLTALDNYRGTVLNGVRDVKISGNYAFVSSYNRDNLAVLDISNPSSISYITEYRDTTNMDGAWGVKIIGNYAYVSAYRADKIQVIDISTPTSLTLATTIDSTLTGLTIDGPRDIAVSGDILYIAGDLSDNISAVDVSTPTSPVFINQIVNSGTTRLDGAYGVFKSGLNIYAASYQSDAIEVMELQYATNSPTIIPTTAFTYTGEELTSFTHTLSASNSGSITYQISKNNGATWYWWNGASWATTTGGVTNSSTQANINTNLTSFNALGGGSSQFKWKAFFTSNGDQKTEISSISVTSVAPPAAGPGGVASGLNLWLKSNVGTSTTTNNANLTTWNDQSGNGKNAAAVTAPTYRNNVTDNVNFYPVINFDGSSQFMRNTTGGMSSKSYFAVIIPTNTVDGTALGSVPFGLECLSGGCGLTFGGLVLGSFTAAIPDEVITHALGSSTQWRSSETGVSSYTAGKPMLVSVNENATANGTNLYEKGTQINNYSANTYQTETNTNFSVGASNDAANRNYFNGRVAEIINFSNRLSDSDRIKIESYLSLKYGITLKNGTQNYIASDGSTVMWDKTVAGTYTKDIFGIGRDNLQAFGQVQSKSINNGSVISLQAIGEGTNISPTFVDIANKEFFTVANNGAGNYWSAVDKPGGYDALARRWKAQEVGDVGTMNLDFNVADASFDIPVLNAGTSYYFIRDTNSNGNLADETPSAMTNLGGNVWRAAGVNIANGQIFTIATQSSSNNIPTNISLSSTSINENVVANSTIGTLSTTDADPGDVHTYSLVSGTGDSQNSFFSLSGSTLKLVHSPDYEIRSSYSIRLQTNDGNGGTYQKVFSVSINNLGETNTTTIDLENALNNYKYTITSGNWVRSTSSPYEGAYSYKSDIVGLNSTQACFEVQHTLSGTGTVDFYRSVSSQSGSDFLRFYIDSIEQGTGWSGTAAWAKYTSPDIAAGTHDYKWCYIKDASGASGSDNAFVDLINFSDTVVDVTPPVISSTNVASGSLLPGGNHNIVINYSDIDSGVNTSSDVIELYKWNGTTWGTNIAASGLKLGSKSVNATSATYPSNNLSFGKYLFGFKISDNVGNQSTSTGAVFYIDEPEIIISDPVINIGSVDSFTNNFSPTVTIIVKTVGAGFNLVMNADNELMYDTETISSWDGTKGFGYQKTPYTGTISAIGTGLVISSQGASINTNGNKNIYTYNIQVGSLIDTNQKAGEYIGNIDFGINLTY